MVFVGRHSSIKLAQFKGSICSIQLAFVGGGTWQEGYKGNDYMNSLQFERAKYHIEMENAETNVKSNVMSKW